MVHLITKTEFGRRLGRLFAVCICAVLLDSCSATGGPFGLSREQQQALGEQEHPNIVAAFGGEIRDAELRTYVEDITRRLLASSDQAADPIMTTVLDSPVVNAMALPGHVYVTRGLLALANSEAELAGVIGHEIGHIFEQHTAERVSRGNIAGLGAAVVGILTGNTDAYQVAAQGAQLYLLRFSRSQEYEADLVGVRLLSQAGYDPLGEAEFLNTLNRWSQLEARLSGQSSRPPEFLSTHPNTAERVQRAAEEARVLSGRGTERSRDRFLSAIEHMLYGDDPRRQGFARDTQFFHPDIGITFSVPEGMQLRNTPQAVVAQGRNAQMQFAGAASPEGPAALVVAIGRQLELEFGQPDRFSINGRPGAVGSARANSQNGALDIQIFAVQWQGADHFYFLWVTPVSATGELQNAIIRSVRSLRSMNADEMQIPPTLIVDIETVGGDDTIASLAARTGFDDAREDRFMVINGLEIRGTLRVGDKVKLIR